MARSVMPQIIKALAHGTAASPSGIDDMNRWSFLAVLVVVIGAVAAFAVYAFGWHDGDSGSSSSRQVHAYAAAIAATCTGAACQIKSLDHLGGDDWKVVLRNPRSGAVGCLLIQTNRFAERAGGDFAGAARMRCPERRVGRAAKGAAPIGPAWWDTGQAEDNLDHSQWAFDNGVNGAVFSCIGQGEGRGDGPYYRRFVCTYEAGGPNADRNGRVVLATTGANTFRIITK
jgi:hypothetical protein